MSRIRSFDAPHKGLRNILSEFSLLAGQTGYSDPEQINALQSLGTKMFTLLNNHVHSENEYTLKDLEERMKGASDHDLKDHEELEEYQEVLCNKLSALDGSQNSDAGHQFYLDFTQYHSRYLQHIFYEETITEKLLQNNFTDEELMEHRRKIMQGMDFSILLLWLTYIIPAQNTMEATLMLGGLKKAVPGEAFEKILLSLKNKMTDKQFNNLVNKLDEK